MRPIAPPEAASATPMVSRMRSLAGPKTACGISALDVATAKDARRPLSDSFVDVMCGASRSAKGHPLFLESLEHAVDATDDRGRRLGQLADERGKLLTRHRIDQRDAGFGGRRHELR